MLRLHIPAIRTRRLAHCLLCSLAPRRLPPVLSLQLSHLVAEFLEQPTVDPAVREQFVQFLAARATRSVLLEVAPDAPLLDRSSFAATAACKRRCAASLHLRCRLAGALVVIRCSSHTPCASHLHAHPGLRCPCRSYPRLESALDWLLSIYKFVFPFLVGGAAVNAEGLVSSCTRIAKW